MKRFTRKKKIVIGIVIICMLGTLSALAPVGAYRMGLSQSLRAEVSRLEQEIESERPYSRDVLVTAQKLKNRGLGDKQAAWTMAVGLAEDRNLLDFTFLRSEDPVQNALHNLPQVLRQEDSLIQRAKELNDGIGRLNTQETRNLLVEIRDLLSRKERGYRAVLAAYNT